MELFTPDFGLVFWMFLVFAILCLILWKYAWPVIMKSVDDRADFIDKGVAYAQEAKTQLEHATESAQALIAEAQQKQLEILREATKTKTQIIEEARKAATAEAKKIMDAAAVLIEQSRKESELQFRQQVSEFALQVAGRLMRQELSNDKKQIELADKLLTDIENKN